MNVPYFQVPNAVFELDLKYYEKLVYMYLCRCGNHGGTAFPSYLQIAKKCGISKRTAINAVRTLENEGLIIKQKRQKTNGEHTSNVYEVVTPSIYKGGSAPHALPSACETPPSAYSAPYKELTYKEPNKKKYKENGAQKRAAYFLKTYESNLKDSIEEVISYFYEWYEEYMGEKHPPLKEAQLQRVYDALASFMDTYCLDTEYMRRIVDCYFETPFENCDYRLNHFATEGILLCRMFEVDRP